MRQYLSLLLLTLLTGCAYSQKEKKAESRLLNSPSNIQTKDSLALAKQAISRKNWVDTEVSFSDPAGRKIKICNSLPRGGVFTRNGNKDGYRVFWNSIVNESNSPISIVLEITADSFPTRFSPQSYLKALIPPNTMSPEKLELQDFGVTNISSLLENGSAGPGKLHITLKPHEEYFYNTLIFLHETPATTRSALVLKGQQFYYEIRLDAQPPISIPCGGIEIIK